MAGSWPRGEAGRSDPKGPQLVRRLRGIPQRGHTTSFQIFEGVGVQERGAGARGNGRQEREGWGKRKIVQT